MLSYWNWESAKGENLEFEDKGENIRKPGISTEEFKKNQSFLHMKQSEIVVLGIHFYKAISLEFVKVWGVRAPTSRFPSLVPFFRHQL